MLKKRNVSVTKFKLQIYKIMCNFKIEMREIFFIHADDAYAFCQVLGAEKESNDASSTRGIKLGHKHFWK